MWVIIFLLGAAIGSFLNVCIYRIPRADVSIHSPRRSFCPECGNPINVYDNIPVLSYLLLRGKCRQCRAKISVLYPLVELATAGLFLVMYYHFGLTLEFLLALAFIAVLLPIAVIDAQHYIIPNVIIVTGLVLGCVIVCAIAYQRADVWYLLTRLIGAVARWGGVVVGCRDWQRDFAQKSDGWWRHQVDGTHRIVPRRVARTRDGDRFFSSQWCGCRDCPHCLWCKKPPKPDPLWSVLGGCCCACAFMGR